MASAGPIVNCYLNHPSNFNRLKNQKLKNYYLSRGFPSTVFMIFYLYTVRWYVQSTNCQLCGQTTKPCAIWYSERLSAIGSDKTIHISICNIFRPSNIHFISSSCFCSMWWQRLSLRGSRVWGDWTISTRVRIRAEVRVNRRSHRRKKAF